MASNSKKPVEMKQMKNGEIVEEEDDNELSQRPHIVPPDGGWGWVVMIAAFFCNVVVDGIIFSFGLVVTSLAEAFDEPVSTVAWVASLLSGFYMMAGPFVSSLANRFGFRVVTCVGAVLAGASLALASLVNSVELLYLLIGVFGGTGFGLIYVPAVVAVGFYFEKRRALATGIAVCGSGIGTFCLAAFTTWLLDEYGWRGTLLIHAGLVLNCAVFGAFFRPLEPVHPRKATPHQERTEMEDNEASPGTPLMVRIKRARDEELRKEEEADAAANYKSSTHSVNSPVKLVGLKSKSDSVNSLQRAKKEGGGGASLTSSKRSLRDLEPQPMDREDAFYTGSLHRLPQYRNDPEHYHASVTRIPAEEPDGQPGGKKRKSPFFRALSSMIQFSLFKSLTFDVFCFSSFITFLGFFVPFMYLAARAVENGVDKESASFLLSIIGITNTVGRIICGAFSDHPKVNVLFVSNAALTVGGLVTIATPFFPAYEILCVYAAVFGLSIACFASLRSILLVELLGLENLTNAFGLSLLFTGIAATLGGPMAGMFYDATESYDASFYLSGSMILVSGILCYPLGWINRWEKRRAAAKKGGKATASATAEPLLKTT